VSLVRFFVTLPFIYKGLQISVLSTGTLREIWAKCDFQHSAERIAGYPSAGFQMENALTREETLKGMTIWAAYSNFEEKEKEV
jgi:hypothetical protein